MVGSKQAVREAHPPLENDHTIFGNYMVVKNKMGIQVKMSFGKVC